ncbi:GNAT family N-acetyltransferase [Microbacterium sp. 3J1]|uniref:GNAT family N-acetyltransferase n=1 Tax=Microbacterium sp. 3J1 TaxID=861269 RepID=UPI000A69BA94|nr:GNAT family N-acetyltransferase [Microbacterium sp. 3J1]
MTTTTLTISPLRVPASLTDDDGAEFRAYGELNRLICDEAVGLPEIAPDAAQMLASWQDATDTLHTGFVARERGEIVGMITIDYAQEADAQAAEIDLLVPERHWGTGVEDALLDLAESEARAHGRSLIQTWTLHRPVSSGEMITPRTGWGRIPTTPLADAIAARGYVFEQVERNSEFDLRADPAPLRALLAEADAAAGADYRLLHWMAPTPREFQDGYAAILARLSTDAPSGDMEFVAEHWDADRVVRRERRLTGAGQALSVTAAQHLPSGDLVAYNELLIGADRTRTTHQLGTLVARDHRGHRLGALVKAANLLRWRDLMPLSPAVSTFNAEENRPMLSINETIGFRPVSYAGAWQKRL